MNILDVFAAYFPQSILSADDAALLANMPADSECGADCMRAIAAGATLLGQIRAAHGDMPKGEAMAKDCAAMVADICAVYIAG